MATYDLRRTVDDGEEHDPEVKEFVQRHFYVDNGLVSIPEPEEVVTLLRNTQATLASANLGLHKVVSNARERNESLSHGGLGERHSQLGLESRKLAGAAFALRILELAHWRPTHLPTRCAFLISPSQHAGSCQ